MNRCVVEKTRVSNGKLKGTLRLSRSTDGETALGETALGDIEDGIITHVSVGYRVMDAKPVKRGLLITRWAPHEVSVPSVVADRAAVIQRVKTMTQCVWHAAVIQRVKTMTQCVWHALRNTLAVLRWMNRWT